MDTVHAGPTHHNSTDVFQTSRILNLAAVVSLGVLPWLYAAHALLLGESNSWAGHIAHALRDSLLAFPLAVLAVGVGSWVADRWGIEGDSLRGRVGQAALIALAFAVCLVPSVEVHEYLDRWLDAGAAQAFQGHGLRSSLEGSTDVLGLSLHGLRDGLMGLAAAFPATLLGLNLMAGWRSRPRAASGLPTTTWASPARFVVPATGVLVVLGLGVTALTFTLGEEADPDHGLATHPLLVSAVPTSAVAELDGLRITTRAAQWVSQVPEGKKGLARPVSLVPGGVPDRLYLEFTVENLGDQARAFGRGEVKLEGPSGAAWGPLADDFPSIILDPRDALTTMLIFEVPSPEAGLHLGWVRGRQTVRIPIAITDADRFASKTREITQ